MTISSWHPVIEAVELHSGRIERVAVDHDREEARQDKTIGRRASALRAADLVCVGVVMVNLCLKQFVVAITLRFLGIR
jgi:hypothetical protein